MTSGPPARSPYSSDMDQASEVVTKKGRQIVPDEKDWTWTLDQTCPECGLAAGVIPAAEIAARITAYTGPWAAVLGRPDVRQRPDPVTWSPLEYGCHVRDVCTIFTERVRAMLAGGHPSFANWDQDRAATEDRYEEQDTSEVADVIAASAAELSAAFVGVSGEQWGLTGARSGGSEFTVLSLGRYCLHDLAHHLVDVGLEVP